MYLKIILFFITLYCIKSSLQTTTDRQQWHMVTQLEELHDKEFLISLNCIHVGNTLSDDDIDLLSTECGMDLECLNKKKVSAKKFHEKVHIFESFAKLFMKIVVDNIKKILNSGERSSLEMLVKNYSLYVTRMFSLVQVSKSKAYDWMVGMLIWLNDVKYTGFSPTIFLGNSTQNPAKTLNDNCSILMVIETLYNNPKLEFVYENAQFMTVQNLMLLHLYEKHEEVLLKSMLDINLDWEYIQSWLLFTLNIWNNYLFKNSSWSSLRSNFFNYHRMFLDCIHVRMLFFTWFHVSMSSTMLLKYRKNKKYTPIYKNRALFYSRKGVRVVTAEQVRQHWSAFVDPLKRIMRFLLIKDGIYWEALRIMMEDIMQINKQDIHNLKVKLNNEFRKKVETLHYGKEFNVVLQMKKLSGIKSIRDIFNKIMANCENLKEYANNLQEILTPIDASFLSWCFDEIDLTI